MTGSGRVTGTRRVVVAGGGIGGLTTATLLAQRGCEVSVLEAAGTLGGRARTRGLDGWHFNLGPHAVFRAGSLHRITRSFGLELGGGSPPLSSYRYYIGGQIHGHDLDRVATRDGETDVTAADLAEAATVLACIAEDPDPRLATTTLDTWIDDRVSGWGAAAFIRAFARMASYAGDAGRQAADAAVAQTAIGRSGVIYLDSGWARLVAALRRVAEESGADIRESARVTEVEHDNAVQGVRLSDGRSTPADAVVLAVGGPTDVASVLNGRAQALARGWAEMATPVGVACLDLALADWDRPPQVVIGVDEPVYLSTHSGWADLAPPGGALVHLAAYLGSGQRGDATTQARLERLADAALPGWRRRLVRERFLPRMQVAHDLPSASRGGLPGRVGSAFPEVSGLHLVGDWIGGRGVLADASVASAMSVADHLTTEGAGARTTRA